MTETVKIILKTVAQSRVATNKVNQDYDNLSVRKTRKGNYGLFYKGTFLGLFINGDMVNENELENIKLEDGIMEH